MEFSLFTPRRDSESDAPSRLRKATCEKLKTEAERAIPLIKNWPGHAVTPLCALPGLAQKLGVSRIEIKDEAGRFGLGSFKALGGAYAISRLLAGRMVQAGEGEPDLDYLLSAQGRAANAAVTVCCATDGNHGRSVAWGAQMFGCKAVIFIHQTVSKERERSIAHYGAKVVRTAGNYDDGVREAQTMADREGWTVVSDTSYEGYMDIPLDVMAGYSVMACEAIEQWGSTDVPTHVFLQTGVGSMAASVVVQLQLAYGEDCPKIILVDPENAACWYDSLKAGTPQAVDSNLETIMAGLACGEVSQLAWTLLHNDVEGVVVVDDMAAKETMRLLAFGTDEDAPLVAGESGVGGLAGFVALAGDKHACEALGIDANSRLMFFSTEGATDEKVYQDIVGEAPEMIAKG